MSSYFFLYLADVVHTFHIDIIYVYIKLWLSVKIGNIGPQIYIPTALTVNILSNSNFRILYKSQRNNVIRRTSLSGTFQQNGFSIPIFEKI